jgi:hypothetical protein
MKESLINNIIPDNEILFRYCKPDFFPEGQQEIPIPVFMDRNGQLSCDWKKYRQPLELLLFPCLICLRSDQRRQIHTSCPRQHEGWQGLYKPCVEPIPVLLCYGKKRKT